MVMSRYPHRIIISIDSGSFVAGIYVPADDPTLVSVTCDIQRNLKKKYNSGKAEDTSSANWVIYCPMFDEREDISLGNVISKGIDPVIGGTTVPAVPMDFLLESGEVQKITGYNIYQKHIEIEV